MLFFLDKILFFLVIYMNCFVVYLTFLNNELCIKGPCKQLFMLYFTKENKN